MTIRIRIFETADALSRALAKRIAKALAAAPELVLGLPTGRTPLPLYRELVRLHLAGRADFSKATTFNLDEFVGLAPGDPRSYQAFMRRHLFDHVNLAPGRIHLLNGAAPDLASECARYERAIARAGGIDLQIVGLGLNGHIGFNEPAGALVAATHRTRLRQATRRANVTLFGRRMRAVPTEALSMGMATILGAQQIVLLATGASKARSVERMTAGIVTPRVPASFLQLHRDTEMWLDRAAAGRTAPP
ncbi:MAG TPA: glucosamine-6-phosphate deaminase [Vicinamibacterales bacterium]|jgi:glucosamine-6-phosphate deaminase|nr:glucosamine-6-phosphate deaminase [Vicinamibacterales bacterium]